MSTDNPSILILDHNPRNAELLEQVLRAENYQTTAVTTIDGLCKIITEGFGPRPPNMALLDIAGFDQSIWEPVETLRAKGIPFLLISAGKNLAVKMEGEKRGAAGVLIKPLVAKELLNVIKTLITTTL